MLATTVPLFRRSVEEGGNINYELPAWSLWVILIDLVVFVPLLFFAEYTVGTIYPIYSMVEDENPPAYAALSADDEEHATATTRPTDGAPRTVTSSLRAVTRLLYAVAGVRGFFRGILFQAIQYLMTVILVELFTQALGLYFTPIATLLASLTLVQFSAAWVHIVLTHPVPGVSHFRRLPTFTRAFDATWRPVLLNWLALEVVRWVPTVLFEILNVHMPEYKNGGRTDVSDVSGADLAKLVAIAFVSAFAGIALVIPARVILVRVQASLLPEEVDAIIPFDRSFQGKVVPAVAGGRGYATVAEAWTTFSRAGWRRLITLYIKAFLVTVGVYALIAAVSIPEFLLIVQKTGDNGDEL
ncbi:hypothetical protein ISF_05577 [Cordyceps fumosorosea ARSEF 2679]|uniref:Ubiquitin carrier protein n=1 Tax=Cordyceps fumosorosea (strain ARSEF 2679) TaxID=1081104 RepID=A0A167UEA0_CORFA|nr:hypothetical protein ISF_05577 [Cordyceps fumosorosea ARSEF 2679]OAA61498.1 hypothetical protein ISF_05577 [Cordyceps fumosorosea ARSEF 2679]